MKPSFTILSCIALLTTWASADLPKKMPISRYNGLWMNSPFTSKPPPTAGAPEVNPLDDYALAGVSPISGGYRVTLINKKTPDERIMVDSDNPNAKFKILGVTRKDGDPLGTTVRLTSGSLTGTVSYDPKLLTLVAAAPKVPKPQPGSPPMPGSPQGQPVPGEPVRQPRPRVVPPPTPQSGQPAGQPVVPHVQQPIQHNNQRPERRRN
ncbi:MAG: hypothetical protein ABI600_21210 [Luteolibacter sp.]